MLARLVPCAQPQRNKRPGHPGDMAHPSLHFLQAREAQDDLVKTKEELHLVMTTPPPPPPMYEPVSYHVRENLHEEGAEPLGYSAELSSEGILDDRNEEKRLTEAEKNERVQRQLLVSTCGVGGHSWGAQGSPLGNPRG